MYIVHQRTLSKGKSHKQVNTFDLGVNQLRQWVISRTAPTTMCFWCSISQGTTSWNSNSLWRGKTQLIRSHQNCSYTTLTQIMVVRIKTHLGKAESTKHQCTVKAAGSSQSLCQRGLHQVSQQETGTRVYCSGTDWPLSPKYWTRLFAGTLLN